MDNFEITIVETCTYFYSHKIFLFKGNTIMQCFYMLCAMIDQIYSCYWGLFHLKIDGTCKSPPRDSTHKSPPSDSTHKSPPRDGTLNSSSMESTHKSSPRMAFSNYHPGNLTNHHLGMAPTKLLPAMALTNRHPRMALINHIYWWVKIHEKCYKLAFMEGYHIYSMSCMFKWNNPE